MIIPHYYEDPHTLHVGTMPNRAYYIPAWYPHAVCAGPRNSAE